jgi:hypothetical protein
MSAVAPVIQPSTRHAVARKAPDSPTRRLGNQNTATLLKDVDMSRHPHFWKKVEDQITRNSLVRVPCCEEQPGNFWFNCSSIMGRDDE